MVGSGPFNLKAGEWTDDTSMALCLAESLLCRRSCDPIDQLERYVRWYRSGHLSSNGVCFDIGNTVKAALELFEKTGEPYCGSTDHSRRPGNGSLMRLTPAPLYYARNIKLTVLYAADSSRTTHGAPVADRRLPLFCSPDCRCRQQVPVKPELLSDHYSPVPGLWNKQPAIRN